MTPLLSRTLAIALLLVVLFSIYAGLISPAVSLYQANDVLIGQMQQREAQYQNLTQRRAALEEKRTELLSLHPTNYFLNSSSDALAAAELQAFVKKVIERANGKLVSIQPLPAPDGGVYREVRIQVRMEGSTDTMRSVLYDLETGSPLLLIRNLSIAKSRGSTALTRHTIGQQALDNLDVNFDLMGFMRTKAS